MIIPLLAAATLMTQEPLLIDCDPGRFTDDNVAIAMIARSGKFRIAGITVVAGNVWANEGLRNARATVQMLDLENVPVHLGAQQPLRHTAEMAAMEKPLEFAGAFDLRKPRLEPETAVDFLIETLEKQPMRVLAIGPLTNIAQAIRKKPSIVANITQLVIMGGNLHVPGNSNKTAEFNFWFDPEAADIVLQSAIADKVLIGLDVCNKAEYGKDLYDTISNGKAPFRHIFREQFGFAYPGFQKDPKAKGFLWDELAAAYLLEPALLTKSQTAPLAVETEFGARYGAVKATKAEVRPVRVMLDLHRENALKLYADLLK